ncbi:HNH endonuclease [Tellurirhabdus bombi]
MPINKGADPWDQTNWQALCMKCHSRKNNKDRSKK